MKIKTLNLDNAQLDYAVAVASRLNVELKLSPSLAKTFTYFTVNVNGERYQPTTDWLECGRILTEQLISVAPFWSYSCGSRREAWEARQLLDSGERTSVSFGSSPQEAALRCFVLMAFGDEVDIPPELIKESS